MSATIITLPDLIWQKVVRSLADDSQARLSSLNLEPLHRLVEHVSNLDMCGEADMLN